MRVLHVIPAIAPRYGGPSRAVLDMAEALQQQGVDIVVATTDADGRGRLSESYRKYLDRHDVKVNCFKRVLSERFKFAPTMSKWLDSHVSSFDLVHIHAVFNHSSIAAGRACRKYGIPYIVRPLGTLDPWSLDQKRFFKRVLLRFGAEALIRGAEAIHCTTDTEYELATQLQFRLPASLTSALGVRDESSPSDKHSNNSLEQATSFPSHFVLYLGRVHRKKRLEALIEAFAMATVASDLLHWHLVFGGTGEPRYDSQLRRLVSQLEIGERVHFMGWLDEPARSWALRKAGLLALVSYQENFGMSVAEAMAVGTPVMVTKDVNLASQISDREAGWVVDPKPAEMSRQLIRILLDPKDRSQRGLRAAAFARSHFDWDVIARRLKAAYSSILGSPSDDAIN